jgi:hypothetical protein
MQASDLARLLGAPLAEVEDALADMAAEGVYSTADDGVIYSRRMVRDEAARQQKVEAGRKGGRASRT